MNMKIFSYLTTIWMSTTVFAQATPDLVHAHASTNAIELTPVFLNQLVKELEAKNPAILASLARTNAAAASVRAVRSWEDPIARVGGIGAREELRASDGDLLYAVEQKLPLFGKPAAARRVALAGLATERASSEYQFQIVRRDLAKAAFRIGLADEVVLLGAQDLNWLEAVTQSVERKFGTGQATLVEALQMQNERSRRATQLQTDRQNLDHERVALNRLLNRDLHSPWPPFLLPPVAGPVIYDERLVQFALENEPKLKVLRRQVQQAETVVDSTRHRRLPDMTVGFEGRNYSGDGSFRQGMVALSVNLPWVNAAKYRDEVKRDEANVKAAEYDLRDYELSVREDLHHLTVKIDAARREALLYRDEIIPRTESGLESARSGWEANRTTFRDVMEARRMWLEGRSRYARAVTEQYEMLSELVLCCGLGNLEALQMIDALPKQK